VEDGSFGASGVGVCRLMFLRFLFQLAMEEVLSHYIRSVSLNLMEYAKKSIDLFENRLIIVGWS
jgi:hypothetical protein